MLNQRENINVSESTVICRRVMLSFRGPNISVVPLDLNLLLTKYSEFVDDSRGRVKYEILSNKPEMWLMGENSIPVKVSMNIDEDIKESYKKLFAKKEVDYKYTKDGEGPFLALKDPGYNDIVAVGINFILLANPEGHVRVAFLYDAIFDK